MINNEKNISLKEDPPTGITWTLAFISCIVTVWFLLVTTSIYYLSLGHEQNGKVTSVRYDDRHDIKFSQEQLLQKSGWNKGTDVVTGEEFNRLQMPIDTIFDLMAEKNLNSKVSSKTGEGDE